MALSINAIKTHIKAAQLMGNLHDNLKEIGYIGHDLEVYLVRILFCLFAEDTIIFNKQQFQDYIEQRTNEDGSDLASKIQYLFEVLNTPTEQRLTILDKQLSDFPYINNHLFSTTLSTNISDSKTRNTLLNCCYFDWSTISPAIFGAMFQSIMNPKERREVGAHYTSETNILKLIKPLFLDTLWEEFESIKNNKGKTKQTKLEEFQKKISTLKFLDPACGCGNFLIIAYRELRLLELEIVKELYKKQQVIDIHKIILMNVNQFYGIEIEEFPARIAEVAIWLVDHQMNMIVSSNFGQYFKRIPLTKQATIVHGNALRINWHDVLPITECSYILGNPPFIGKQYQSKEQKEDLLQCIPNTYHSGNLDYILAWFYKAASYIKDAYIKNHTIDVAFVSTNSIVQGEQAFLVWPFLLENNICIFFAHRTFAWKNEARGNAAVHCVIIGFSLVQKFKKYLFDYEDIKGTPLKREVKNINPYLCDADNIIITNHKKSISDTLNICLGNMPRDEGHLLLSKEEKDVLIREYPESKTIIRKFLGAEEFINNKDRYCLWITDKDIPLIKKIPPIKDRVEAVKKFRLQSTREATRQDAETPHRFAEIRHSNTEYLLIPSTSSELRKYVPIGYVHKNIIASNATFIVPNASLYHFGILTSKMHMSWLENIGGRLKSDYRYSAIVYNSFPWPIDVKDSVLKKIEEKAEQILKIRDSLLSEQDTLYHSLADMYGENMPKILLKAHNDLDKVVDEAYRNKKQPFINDLERISFLFTLYEQYTANLFTEEKIKKAKHLKTNKI